MTRNISRRLYFALLVASMVGSLSAPAAMAPITDSDLLSLGYLFVALPAYVLLIAVALVVRFASKVARGQNAATAIRAAANLLAPIMVAVYYGFKIVIRPLLPGHYSDFGYLVTWSCIASPIPIVVLATYIISRAQWLYRVASSAWWCVLYGAIAAALLFEFYRG